MSKKETISKKWSLHTHTNPSGSVCYLVPIESNGAFEDAEWIGDPLEFEGKIKICSDEKGRKIIEVIE